MIWTLIILVIAIALYMFGFKLFKLDGKKASTTGILMHKGVNAIAAVVMAACVCRLVTPVYLTKTNPAILQEMVAAMQAQQEEAKNRIVRDYVSKHADEMVGSAPIAGNVDAKKTIFLWSDYSCPYCRRVHGDLMRVLAERNDVRLVLKNFSIHGALSDAPAKAVIAAKIQDNAKAAALDKLLMDKEYYKQEDLKDQAKLPEIIENNVMKLAKEAGLDTKKLAEDMKGDVVNKELRNVRELAQRFEISGTPYLIIGDKAFPGAIPYGRIMDALK
ncbi:MAG: thioredoxin domain-containing protein [Alphaproteobacteria bacterium]|nr:thioredoxin domain-containing protein [Alphaproteobacteria bacterium]